MNKVLVTAVAVVAIGFSGAAMADTIRNKIRSVDTENNLLTLKNGLRFHYADDINEAELVVGKNAKVTYKKSKGVFEATKIEVSGKGSD